MTRQGRPTVEVALTGKAPFTWTKSADETFERLAGYVNRLPKLDL